MIPANLTWTRSKYSGEYFTTTAYSLSVSYTVLYLHIHFPVTTSFRRNHGIAYTEHPMLVFCYVHLFTNFREAEDYKMRGNAAYKEGEYSEARELYTKAIYHNPSNAGYYGNRSATLLMLEEYQRALEDAVTSIKLDERFIKGYLRAAKCHLMLGNPSLSMDYYHKVLEQSPSNTQAKQEVSVVANALGISCGMFVSLICTAVAIMCNIF